jgi:trans-2-enoyl-CoA reductase
MTTGSKLKLPPHYICITESPDINDVDEEVGVMHYSQDSSVKECKDDFIKTLDKEYDSKVKLVIYSIGNWVRSRHSDSK